MSKDGSNPYKGFSRLKLHNNGVNYYDYRETARAYSADEIQQLVNSLVDDPAWWSYFSNPPTRDSHNKKKKKKVILGRYESPLAPPPPTPPPPPPTKIFEFNTKNLFKKESPHGSSSDESGVFCGGGGGGGEGELTSKSKRHTPLRSKSENASSSSSLSSISSSSGDSKRAKKARTAAECIILKDKNRTVQILKQGGTPPQPSLLNPAAKSCSSLLGESPTKEQCCFSFTIKKGHQSQLLNSSSSFKSAPKFTNTPQRHSVVNIEHQVLQQDTTRMATNSSSKSSSHALNKQDKKQQIQKSPCSYSSYDFQSPSLENHSKPYLRLHSETPRHVSCSEFDTSKKTACQKNLSSKSSLKFSCTDHSARRHFDNNSSTESKSTQTLSKQQASSHFDTHHHHHHQDKLSQLSSNNNTQFTNMVDSSKSSKSTITLNRLNKKQETLTHTHAVSSSTSHQGTKSFSSLQSSSIRPCLQGSNSNAEISLKSPLQNSNGFKKVVIKLVKTKFAPFVAFNGSHAPTTTKENKQKEAHLERVLLAVKQRGKQQQQQVKNLIEFKTKKNKKNKNKRGLLNYLKSVCIGATLRKLELFLQKRVVSHATTTTTTTLTLSDHHVYFNFLKKRFIFEKGQLYACFRRFRCLNSFVHNFVTHVLLLSPHIPLTTTTTTTTTKTTGTNDACFLPTRFPKAKTFAKPKRGVSHVDPMVTMTMKMEPSGERQVNKSQVKSSSSSPADDLRLFMKSCGFKDGFYAVLLDIVLNVLDTKRADKLSDNLVLRCFLSGRKRTNLSKNMSASKESFNNL